MERFAPYSSHFFQFMADFYCFVSFTLEAMITVSFTSLLTSPHSTDRCQAKFLTCAIDDFTPSAHAQSDITGHAFRERRLFNETSSAVSAQLCPTQNAYRCPPNGDLQKKVMLHLGAEWSSKQYILIADIISAEPGP